MTPPPAAPAPGDAGDTMAETTASAATATVTDEARALREANALLRRIGFGARQFARFEDLVASASSMSVALYEKLFQVRLEHVERAPRSLAHYEGNAQRVLDALSAALLEVPPPPPPREEDGGEGSGNGAGVTGAALCAGDVRAIRQVVRMFEHVLSLLAAASIAPLPSKAREKSCTPRKLKAARSLQRRNRNGGGNSSSSESSHEWEPRATRRATSREHFGRSGDVAARRRVREQQQRGVANLYETSDASITRSRAGDFPLRRRRLESGDEHHRSDHHNSDLVHDGNVAAGSREGSDPLATTVRRRRGTKETKVRSNPSRSKEGSGDTRARRGQVVQETGVTDPNSLLETQKYGRFVPVATARTRHTGSRRGSSEASSNQVDDGTNEPVDGEDTAGLHEGGEEGEQMYFGGVSSVSGGSRSDESVHFLEEDGDASRDFSSSNVVDLQDIPPRNALSPSNAYDDEPHPNDHRSSRSPTDSKRALEKTRKPNQEMEEEEGEAVSDPDKKLSPHKSTSKTAADRPTGASVRTRRDPASSLYPLLPKKSAATSKSQAEYTRYKLFLKDHLQDLRRKEYCQRLHLERACKVGEHSANVEKIRAQRFQQDIRLQRIALGLEAKNEEEKHLRHTLAHILELEKAKLRDEHRTTSSILRQIKKNHLEREVAVETFYSNQIELVKERTHREVRERELVQKAHRLASEQMIREMRREREHQVAALLQEKQHLEEARRFRTAARLSSALERGDDARARASHANVDAFYTAAMKARQHNAHRGGSGLGAKATKQAAKAYASARLGPAARRA